jgi:hypothetical protein
MARMKILPCLVFVLVAAAVAGLPCARASDAARPVGSFIERVGLAAGCISFIDVVVEQVITPVSMDDCAIVVSVEVRGSERKGAETGDAKVAILANAMATMLTC